MTDTPDTAAARTGGWFRDTPESRRLLEIERAKVEAAEAEYAKQALEEVEYCVASAEEFGLGSIEVDTAKLRAVLAEHRQMRETLDALSVVWESIYSSGEYATKAEALNAATRDRFGTAAVDEDVMWRLVGGWQPAGEAPAQRDLNLPQGQE